MTLLETQLQIELLETRQFLELYLPVPNWLKTGVDISLHSILILLFLIDFLKPQRIRVFFVCHSIIIFLIDSPDFIMTS